MTITKEQFDEFIESRWNETFFQALVEHMKLVFLKDNEKSKEEYRYELKQLIWEGISDGVKRYLEEVDPEEFCGYLSKAFLTELKYQNLKMNIEF